MKNHNSGDSQEKLSFILPLAFKETGVGSEELSSWRKSPDNGCVIRTRTMLSSFISMFDQSDLGDFFLVCPPRDMLVATSLLRSITPDSRFQVISEHELCPEIDQMVDESTNQVIGWYAQQLVKLAICKVISTQHYVTFDSDIVCIRPFSYNSLIRDGRALLNVETVEDYKRIYVDSMAKAEQNTKRNRYRRSGRLLGYNRCENKSDVFYGETPVIMHVDTIDQMAEYIYRKYDMPWRLALATQLPWTEYTLYFQFLEMIGSLEHIYRKCGCNKVLDLEKSIWHRTALYRKERVYDKSHFEVDHDSSSGGYFVAIQSWLPLSSWLPDHMHSLSEFYRDLEKILSLT